MINGKIPEHQLFEEKFSYAELYEAAKKSPWAYAFEDDQDHSSVNIEFAIRWMAEWIVLHKREPKYEPGVVYQDAEGSFYILEVDGRTGVPTGRWSSFGTNRVFPSDFPERPLTPMVPLNAKPNEAAVPPKRGEAE